MKPVIVVLPAFYAERTLEPTVHGLAPVYDHIILCDDGSRDETAAVARELGIQVLVHPENRGYGANQKTLYRAALELDPEVVVMVHPDNQYRTDALPQGIEMIRSGAADFVMGSRVASARADGMPWWRWYGNRFLTAGQRLVFRSRLSEFHSGLRLYRADLLRRMPFERFSDDFAFDSETIAWAHAHGARFGEIPARCVYGEEVSSINFRRSVVYGTATLVVLGRYLAGSYHRMPAVERRPRAGLSK